MANETTVSIVEKRKLRNASRKAARKALTEKLKDAEFSKTYFAAKKTRAASRVAAFKKAKSGKK